MKTFGFFSILIMAALLATPASGHEDACYLKCVFQESKTGTPVSVCHDECHGGGAGECPAEEECPDEDGGFSLARVPPVECCDFNSDGSCKKTGWCLPLLEIEVQVSPVLIDPCCEYNADRTKCLNRDFGCLEYLDKGERRKDEESRERDQRRIASMDWLATPTIGPSTFTGLPVYCCE